MDLGRFIRISKAFLLILGHLVALTISLVDNTRLFVKQPYNSNIAKLYSTRIPTSQLATRTLSLINIVTIIP